MPSTKDMNRRGTLTLPSSTQLLQASHDMNTHHHRSEPPSHSNDDGLNLLHSVQTTAIRCGIMEMYIGSGLSGGWVEYWFVICRDSLWYCKIVKADSEVTYVPLSESTTTNITGSRTFTLVSGSQTFSLRCFDDLDLIAWTDALNNHLTMVGENEVLQDIENGNHSHTSTVLTCTHDTFRLYICLCLCVFAFHADDRYCRSGR